GMEVAQRGNAVLGALLAELNWSPGLLAEAVNRLLGPGHVARSTVSDWLHHDRLPRGPLPTVVAHVISDSLGREICLDELWSGRAVPAELWVPADAGMDQPWTPTGTVQVLDDWLGHTGGAIGMDRRFFLAVSGGALTAPAWAYVDHLGARGGSFAALLDGGRTMTVTAAMVDTVAATTAAIRNLGDIEGGNDDTLRFVHHHLTYIARLLRQARFTNAAVADRLLAEWAQLSQQAGWLAHDTGEHGLSQRYFTSGLHAAHTAGDRSVGVYLLACMGSCTVNRGRLADGADLSQVARDAMELANAAHEAARSTPLAVRALAADRFAQAQAAAGNTRGFHTAADEARALLDTPGALESRPAYLTWYGPASLEGHLAHGALTLAAVTSRDSHRLIDGAEATLGRVVTDTASTPRRTVFSAAWLARAHVAAGDLDRAVPAGLTALRWLPTVRSRRCALVLRRLETDLAALPPTHRPAALRSLQDHLRATRAA
ncbi:MAG: hypothetical protein ACRDRX_00080, partial [Pseudonocardiaceae bacterium]